ncbi:Uncharacterised protein [Nocardia africana]|uniref:Uncharacterized protein n=1 Tax=Nocardia africana TaxID=134964 RepID=A0A378WIQ9_9NOCA|nr:Uncharacterised protein [Nocardia africana]
MNGGISSGSQSIETNEGPGVSRQYDSTVASSAGVAGEKEGRSGNIAAMPAPRCAVWNRLKLYRSP